MRIIALLILFIPLISFSQSPITFEKIITADSLSKHQIFDKVLVWCSKNFNDSKSAIAVKERDGGVIGGKALYKTYYEVMWRGKKQPGLIFVNYFFDWLIEIKDGRLRFSLSNLVLKENTQDYSVTTSETPPYEVMFMHKDRWVLEWKESKAKFLNNINLLMVSLEVDLKQKKEDW